MRLLALVVLVTACGGGAPAAPDIDAPSVVDAGPPCVPSVDSTAPTYTDLYAQFFARGTHGHCANAGCHSDPGHNVWLCGSDKDSCYAGMVSIHLIDTTHGDQSMIGNPDISPLSWISPNGNMPFDAVGAFPAGRDAILAWVGDCAQNN
jgi:hypothetical protein